MGILVSNHKVLRVGGAGGDVGVRLQQIVPVSGGIKVCDAKGYIGGAFMQAYYPQSYMFYDNFAIVVDGANFAGEGLGRVTLLASGTSDIGGRTYRTVVIGGKEWLAENLDFKFSGLAVGQSGTSTTEPRANYYNNAESTYGIDGTRKCGLLYNWPAVKFLNDNRSELIPGWHVPTPAEWDALATAVGGASTAGTVLKAPDGFADGSWPTGWNGNDDYGFSVLPAGRYSGSFGIVGSYAYFWTATEYSGNSAYSRYFSTGASMDSSSFNKYYGYSVRLVKDSEGA